MERREMHVVSVQMGGEEGYKNNSYFLIKKNKERGFVHYHLEHIHMRSQKITVIFKFSFL